MLSKHDNELITRVGPGTPMGTLMREKYSTVPPGVDDPTVYRVRSGGVFLPENADWVEATRELRQAFMEHPQLDPTINGPL